MFTTRLSRAAPRATGTLSSTSSSTTVAAAGQGARCLATRPAHGHGRRHSSSKASPPSDSAGTKPAPQQQQQQQQQQAKDVDGSNASGTGSGRRKSGMRRAGGITGEGRREKGLVGKEKEREDKGVDRFAGLPSVPSLQGLDRMEVQKDLSISSFFSLHRPISLTTPIPPVVNSETFSSIFSERSATQDPWHNGNSAERRPEDIIITLNNTIEMLEGNQSQAENEGVRWEVLNESSSNNVVSEGGVKHLDGAPRMKSLDELVANFRPFRAPPPPEPFDEKYMQSLKGGMVQQQKKKASGVKARKPKQKVYITEIRVTESTHSDGRKTYAASSTPIRRLQEENANTVTTTGTSRTSTVQDMALPSATRQTFLQRIRQRQERGMRAQMAAVNRPVWMQAVKGLGWRRKEEWVLISVKRQRKLKMKKHKHKKLMKRTRNLRRRLGRT